MSFNKKVSFSFSKRKVSLPNHELVFQTYSWEIGNCTTQAGSATPQLKMEKLPPNVNTTTAEYVQEEAEEENKM